MSWRVYVGGEPSENSVVCDSLTLAWTVAFDMAYTIAGEKGIDESDIDSYAIYIGDNIERGVGPRGDDCAYWPHIEEVES